MLYLCNTKFLMFNTFCFYYFCHLFYNGFDIRMYSFDIYKLIVIKKCQLVGTIWIQCFHVIRLTLILHSYEKSLYLMLYLKRGRNKIIIDNSSKCILYMLKLIFSKNFAPFYCQQFPPPQKTKLYKLQYLLHTGPYDKFYLVSPFQ